MPFGVHDLDPVEIPDVVVPAQQPAAKRSTSKNKAPSPAFRILGKGVHRAGCPTEPETAEPGGRQSGRCAANVVDREVAELLGEGERPDVFAEDVVGPALDVSLLAERRAHELLARIDVPRHCYRLKLCSRVTCEP